MEKSETKPGLAKAGQLPIKSYGIAPDASSQAYLARRVEGKLGKFAALIQGLEIRMKRQGWAGSAPLVTCAVSVTLDGCGQVAVERSALEAREAFDHTMGVVERLIRRTLQRLRYR